MRGEKETRPCANCGQQLTRLVSQAKGKTWYCSTRCQAAHSPSPITISATLNPYHGSKATWPCEQCGKPVTRYLSARRLAQFWTCSRRCMGIVNMARRKASGLIVAPKPRRGREIPCTTCGQPVYLPPFEASRSTAFCSRPCKFSFAARNQETRTCLVCAKTFQTSPSRMTKYCSMDCWGVSKTKRGIGRMHNGKQARLNKQGYVLVWQPDHRRANGAGWVLEHRLVVERIIGRPLLTAEQVDHINSDRSDNRAENLQILSPEAHGTKSARGLWTRVTKDRTELAEYRRLHGPLEN